MKLLIFDTETSGLPLSRNIPLHETNYWPYILQLSYVFCDTEKNYAIKYENDIIKISKDVNINSESEKIHGINYLLCKRKGICIKKALCKFNDYLRKADKIIGHNIDFDKNMIYVEGFRNNILINNIKSEYCTMKKNIHYCGIERLNKNGNKYLKYPTLNELNSKIFNMKPKGLHDALVDVLVCLRCYLYIEESYDIIENKIFKKLYNLLCI